MVHGQACLKTPAHPSCTHTKEGTKPGGKIYVVDLKPVLGSDWRVRARGNLQPPLSHGKACMPEAARRGSRSMNLLTFVGDRSPLVSQEALYFIAKALA